MGRTFIICVIVVAISIACCVALSIQQSAEVARNNSKSNLKISAKINVDRQYVMQSMSENTEEMTPADAIKNITGLSLEEMKKYALAESVDDFFYYATISLNGDNDLEALNKTEYPSAMPGMEGGQGGQGAGPQGGPGPGMGGSSPSIQDMMAMLSFQGDFMLYGYLNDKSMADFQSGACYVTEGGMFAEGTEDYDCIISEELATLNGLSVGDQITLTNPSVTSERYVLNVVGFYKNSADTTTVVNGASNDPANHILTSFAVLDSIVNKSAVYQDPAATDSTVQLEDGRIQEQLLRDDGILMVSNETGTVPAEVEDSENKLTMSVIGSYEFTSIDSYDHFETEVRSMGLEDKYTVTSSDVAAYEASLVPLDNLAKYAGSFLVIVLAVGAIILISVSLFNIQHRKYELGALTAMGMRKGKVAIQFVTELTLVTFLGICIGASIGVAVSKPVANVLLSAQVEYEKDNSGKTAAYFGREAGGQEKPHGGDIEGEVTYVDYVTYTVDTTLVVRMVILGAILAALSSTSAVLFVLRYDPLDILAKRD